MLATVADKLKRESGDFGFRVFSDSAPLLEKRLAVEAGLGWIGRNSLLVNPAAGSFLLLGEIVTDAEVDLYDEPCRHGYDPGSVPDTDSGTDPGADPGSGSESGFAYGCGNCRRCVERCPNRAITAHGLDTGRCISRLTVEKLSSSAVAPVAGMPPEGTIPAATSLTGTPSAEGGFARVGPSGSTFPAKSPYDGAGRPSLNGWLFGCDECQSVCPYNAATPLYSNPAFTPVFDPCGITAGDWLSMDEDEFLERFGDTALCRTGLKRLKENISG
jgi:epoxyqueuosine reductase